MTNDDFESLKRAMQQTAAYNDRDHNTELLGKNDLDGPLNDRESIAAFLTSAFGEEDRETAVSALRTVAKQQGMAKIAQLAEMSRGGLYKMLGKDGNPTLSALLRILDALGVRLTVQVRTAPPAPPADPLR